MSWQTTLTLIVRGIIGDFDTPYQYSDQRLQQIITIGAQFVTSELTLPYNYTIDVVNLGITPDPTGFTPPDNASIVLFTLRAACFLDQGSMRQKAGGAIRIGDARSSIDATKLVEGFQLIMDKGACNSYEEAKFAYQMGGLNSTAVGQAILGPFAIISSYGAVGYQYAPNSPVGRETFF